MMRTDEDLYLRDPVLYGELPSMVSTDIMGGCPRVGSHQSRGFNDQYVLQRDSESSSQSIMLPMDNGAGSSNFSGRPPNFGPQNFEPFAAQMEELNGAEDSNP